jgi:hypothetical protein
LTKIEEGKCNLVPLSPQYERFCSMLSNVFLVESPTARRWDPLTKAAARIYKSLATSKILSLENEFGLGLPTKTTVNNSRVNYFTEYGPLFKLVEMVQVFKAKSNCVRHGNIINALAILRQIVS